MELVSRCVECGLAEPESLASLGGSAPGVVDGILSSARHTLSNQQAQLKEAETVNLIENDAKSLSRPLAWLL